MEGMRGHVSSRHDLVTIQIETTENIKINEITQKVIYLLHSGNFSITLTRLQSKTIHLHVSVHSVIVFAVGSILFSNVRNCATNNSGDGCFKCEFRLRQRRNHFWASSAQPSAPISPPELRNNKEKTVMVRKRYSSPLQCLIVLRCYLGTHSSAFPSLFHSCLIRQ